MSDQRQIIGSRVFHIRELQSEIARLREENTRLKSECESLTAHFDLALLAAEDLRNLPAGARLVVVDGWNQILGSARTASSREELIAAARAEAAANADRKIWIVFDGPRPNSRNFPEGVRVTYTGGIGAHRADRFICDFLRMARFSGAIDRIEVRTDDRDFRREVERLTANR